MLQQVIRKSRKELEELAPGEHSCLQLYILLDGEMSEVELKTAYVDASAVALGDFMEDDDVGGLL